MKNFSVEMIVKFLGILLLAGVIWGRTEMRMKHFEDALLSQKTVDSDLVVQIRELTNEVIQLRIALAETRVQVGTLKERK